MMYVRMFECGLYIMYHSVVSLEHLLQVLLDFYQVHTYANDLNGRFSKTSPMTMSRDEYQISDKPCVIGEFSATKCESTGCTIESLYEHALSSKYDGAWDWSMYQRDVR